MSVRVSGKITLDGEPLKRNFIDIKASFIRIARPGINLTRTIATLITDDDGDFSANIEVPSFIPKFNKGRFTIGVHCQNSVIRVLEASGVDLEIIVEKKIQNGGVLNLTQSDLGSHYDHFRILTQCIDVYDRVWRQFRPYNRANRNAFPLKRRASIQSTFDSSEFAQVTYPSLNPGLTFVEPADPGNNGLPLVHLEDNANDTRLFGSPPIIMPHELGHVYHFSAMDLTTRAAIELNYVGFILNNITNAFHGPNIRTTQFVAFIEAIGIFSERFYFFSKLIRPDLTGVELRKAFWKDELSTQSLSASTALGPHYTNVGILNTRNQLTSSLIKAKDVEGRVYGAIYLHLAKKIGLREVVGLVMDSKALTFDDFKAYVINLGDSRKTNAINAVENTWFN